MPNFDQNDPQLVKLSASSGSSLVGFQQAGTGAVTTDLQTRGRYVVNAADFGVKCDGVTNDTSAMNQAIAYANSHTSTTMSMVIEVNAGNCLITPGGLTPLLCDLHAPRTTFISATNALANLITIGVDTGSSATFSFSQTITVYALVGYNFVSPWTTNYGYGLGFSGTAGQYTPQVNFTAFNVAGFTRGLNLDASVGFHIGGASIYQVNTIQNCAFGIYLIAQNLQVESNYFYIGYMEGCLTNIALQTIGTSICGQNVFEIGVLELHILANTIGFSLSGVGTIQNKFIVDDIFYNANTQYIVSADSSASGNEFNLPTADLSKISWGAQNVLKMNGVGLLNNGNPTRSTIYGPSPAPVAGPAMSAGDRYCVNNPALGAFSSYVIANGAWQGESHPVPATWINYTPTVSSNVGAITSYTVNTAKYIPHPNYVQILLDITITNNGTGSGSLLVTTPTGFSSAGVGGVLSGRESVTSGLGLTGTCSNTSINIFTTANGYPVSTNSRIVLSGFFATT